MSAVWLLSRPYNGIVHDSRIYIGRALANLDPTGVGRDALFAFDGQTKFTLYTALIQPLVRMAGASQASVLLTLAELLLWLAAAAWLVRRFAPETGATATTAALICAAVLPAAYGPLGVLSFGESFATPRCLAEAAVLGALPALLGGRSLLCWALLAGAALLHPIMALAGCGAAFLVLASEDRRWWALAGAGVGAAILAALTHWMQARAALAPFDPAWLAIVKLRTPYLFERAWPIKAWSDTGVGLTTLVVAIPLAQGRVRTLLFAVVVVASSALTLTFVGSDLAASKLLVQLQFWRALWLVQALAVLVTPFCIAQSFSSAGRDCRSAVVLMLGGWCLFDTPALAIPCCALALLAVTSRRHPRFGDMPDRFWPACLIGVGVLAAIVWILDLIVGVRLARTALQAGADLKLSYLLDTDVFRFPLIATTLGLTLLRRSQRLHRPGLLLAVAAVLLVPLVLLLWDQRTPTRAMMDRGEDRADLVRLFGRGSGAVLWRGDTAAPLFWLGRPSWVNEMQGTAGTFSRRLSLQWDRRTRALLASGLGSRRDRSPWARDLAGDDSAPAMREGVARLCRQPNGPSVIVSPGDLTPMFNSGEAVLWRAPRTDYRLVEDHGPKFVRLDRYTIVRCIGHREP